MDKRLKAFENALSLANATIEHCQSTTKALILLSTAAKICESVLNDRYYAKHPDERPKD